MVYGGKPSRGCLTCRARRIKCDEGKPTCNQCRKSKRECAGYKAEFDIVHRDETGRMERKMRRLGVSVDDGQPGSSASRSSSSRGGSKSGSSPTLIHSPDATAIARRPSHATVQSLFVSAKQQAECYFASNFILVPLGFQGQAGPDGGFLEYVMPLIRNDPPGSPLRHAYDACALAALGNRRKESDLTNQALKEHTYALAQTHVALSDPTAWQRDSTLAAILLLSLYETITASKEARMYAWRSHIEGAVRIIKARGRKMLETPTGALLFNAVRYHMVARTLSTGVAPDMGADFWTSNDDLHSIMSGSQRFCLKTSELRAEVSRVMTSIEHSPQGIDTMLEMARMVQGLDQEIATWLVKLPEVVRFKTLCWISPGGDVESGDSSSPSDDSQRGIGSDEFIEWTTREVFPGRVDVYPDVLAAWCWNQARVSRLVLASVNIRIAAWLCSPRDYHLTAEFATSKRICEGTTAEIIASIPYHLGWHIKRKELFATPEFAGFACGDNGPLKALPAFFAIWPLVCVKNLDITSEDQRDWCRGRLRFISEELGLRYADVLGQAEIRFPSMMILRDGSAGKLDLRDLPTRPKPPPPQRISPDRHTGPRPP